MDYDVLFNLLTIWLCLATLFVFWVWPALMELRGEGRDDYED